MQSARSLRAVKINFVAIRNYPEFVEIEMGVPALQRIERPGHLLDPHRLSPLALGELQFVTQVRIAIVRAQPQYMGMHNKLAMLHAEETEGKPDQLHAIK